MIISVSRRCDIPSHFGKWFVNRLNEGYVLVQNPYNPIRQSKVILSKSTIDIIVFWTKNPIPFLKYLPLIEEFGYPYYFQFTLTPYGKEIEGNLPPKEVLIDTFISLAKKLGKHKMIWRYDPIIIDQERTIEYHKEKFAYMAKKLCNSTDRCVISFVDEYKNVTARRGIALDYEMTLSNIQEISKDFYEIAKEHGLSLYTCAEEFNLEEFGVGHGACIDKDIIEKILQCKVEVGKDNNQRKECLCLESVDIGTYNCCNNGCKYCYALQSEKSSMANIKKHNPNSPMLIGEINPNAIITNKQMRSIIKNQVSLFD